MQNLSQPFPKPAHASDAKEQENKQATAYEKKAVCRKRAVCIIGGESRGIRISSRNNGRIKKMTRLVLYKTLHYFCTKLASFGLYGSRNVISTKTFFFISRKLLPILVMKFKIQNTIFNVSTKFKIQILFSTQENCCKFQLQNSKL